MLPNTYLPVESPYIIDHSFTAQLDIIAEQNGNSTMTFDPFLIQQATVQDPIIVVANRNVPDLSLHLQYMDEVNQGYNVMNIPTPQSVLLL